jgi:hypothetical protein
LSKNAQNSKAHIGSRDLCDVLTRQGLPYATGYGVAAAAVRSHDASS